MSADHKYHILYAYSSYKPVHHTITPLIALTMIQHVHPVWYVIYYVVEFVALGLKRNDAAYNTAFNIYGWSCSAAVCMALLELLRWPLARHAASTRNINMLMWYIIECVILLVGYIYFAAYQPKVYEQEYVMNAIAIAVTVAEALLAIVCVAGLLRDRTLK